MHISDRRLQSGMAMLLLWLSMTAQCATQSNSQSLPELKAVSVEMDVSRLPSSEQAALVRILRAAKEMDALYLQQVWPETNKLIERRRAAPTAMAVKEIDALDMYKGPWRLAGGAFIEGVPPERPIGDFYPPGSQKGAVEAWLNSLSEIDRKNALGSFTAIEVESTGSFRTVPYANHYRQRLAKAAKELREAAALTHEITLKKFLASRADALLDDNYFASDVAFVELKGPIDVVLGPYEVDDDTWFGAKTAFEASIALVNVSATRQIAGVGSHLQELEDHLPLPAELHGRKLAAAAPVMVLDAIYHGGFMGLGPKYSYDLPNDVRVLDTAGARTGTYENIVKLDYDSAYLPIAAAVLNRTDQLNLKFEDVRDEVMFVRIVDSLGPQYITGTKTPITESLGAKSPVATQIRSMLLSLWAHQYLIEHGYLNRQEGASVYPAYLVAALSRIRYGIEGPRSQASAYVLNHLLEAGAVAMGPDGRFVINRTAAKAEIARAASEFISAIATGNSTATRSLLDRYVVVNPVIRDVLPRLGTEPPIQHVIYTTAEQLTSSSP